MVQCLSHSQQSSLIDGKCLKLDLIYQNEIVQQTFLSDKFFQFRDIYVRFSNLHCETCVILQQVLAKISLEKFDRLNLIFYLFI